MADTVTTNTLVARTSGLTLVRTGISDGTGESNVALIDKSTLKNLRNDEPSKLRILRVEWSIQGHKYLKLSFDHTNDDTVLVLGTGWGQLDFTECGGLPDPASTGGTGDLLLTVPSGVSTGSYTLKMEVCY